MTFTGFIDKSRAHHADEPSSFVHRADEPTHFLIKLPMNVRIKLTVSPVCPRRFLRKAVFLLWLLFCFLAAFGCAASPVAEPYQPIRSPYPTFTATPVSNLGSTTENTGAAATSAPVATLAATAAPAPATDTPAPPTDTPAPAPTATSAAPRLVVNAPLANVRTGPGTDFTVLTTVERGQEYEIVGKNAAGDWWHFCCVDGQQAWIISELVDIDGATDTVPVTEEVAQAAATATPPPAAATTAPTATTVPAETPVPAAPDFSFELVSAEQFSEPKFVRIFLYVYDGEQALEGYTLHIKKDGADVPVTGASFGGQPGFTWPIADLRQRFQNMKVEFPNVAAAGLWEVQLVDGGGNPVGPPATFTLSANDPNQELYLRYKKR